MPTLTDLVKAIRAGVADNDLALIVEECQRRKRIVGKKRCQQLERGTIFTLENIKPLYLNGVKVRFVDWHGNGKLEVEFDDGISRGRFGTRLVVRPTHVGRIFKTGVPDSTAG